MVPVAERPPRVFDGEQQEAVAVDLLQVLALVTQQALVVLGTWKNVDDVPEAGPATEAAHAHVGGYQAGGGANSHVLVGKLLPIRRRRCAYCAKQSATISNRSGCMSWCDSACSAAQRGFVAISAAGNVNVCGF